MSKFSVPESVASHIELLLIEEALNTLSPQEQQTLELYLAQYPSLAKKRQEVRATMGLMAHAAPPAVAPSSLKTSILKQAKLASVQQTASPLQKRVIRKRVMRWQWAIAASFLLMAMGLDNLYLRNQLRRNSKTLATLSQKVNELEEPHAYVYTFELTGTSAVRDAVGHVVLDFESEEAILAIKNLPVAPDNLAY
jgi:hypothetical protein